MIRQQQYRAGDVVLPSGELGKGFCILESGTLEVIRENKVLSEIDIVGSIFGELSEILGMKRDATIQAKTDATVRHVEESIAEIVTKNPKVAIKLIRTLGRRLYRMNQIATRGDNENNIFKKADHAEKMSDGSVTTRSKFWWSTTNRLLPSNWVICLPKASGIVESATDEASALKACEYSGFSAILISMALPGDTAVDLRRKLKTNHNVLNTPVIGMIVMGDEHAQKKALNSGFADCISKPFDQNKTEALMYKMMNLDSSAQVL